MHLLNKNLILGIISIFLASSCNNSGSSTSADAIEIEKINVFDVNTNTNAIYGNRATTNAACEAEYNNTHSATFDCNHFSALLSYTGDNGGINLPTNQGFPTDVPLRSHTDTLIANDWADFLDDIDVDFSTAGLTNIYRTGFYTDGVAGDNCSDWTSTTGNGAGYREDFGPPGYWLATAVACFNTGAVSYLCLCWQQ
ncbi:MAG: hypothetical protein R3A80_07715 [Bdellovibrionota bacterium]